MSFICVHIILLPTDFVSLQADTEARLFEEFPKMDPSSPTEVREAIKQAAKSTSLVRDLRVELLLLRRLFEEQKRVIQEFADVCWPSDPPLETPEKQVLTGEIRKSLRDSFIRDCGLDALFQRISRIDQDASTTIESVSLRAISALNETDRSLY